MPYSNPPQVIPGEFVDEDDWNLLVDDITFLANPPACRATKSAVQACTTGTGTAITFDTEAFDTDSMHSTSVNTSRLTFNTAGLYLITGFASWALDAAGTYRVAQLRLNGSTVLATQTCSAATLSANTGYEATPTALYKATAAQYVELVMWHDKGSNLNASAICTLSAVWVGVG